YIHMEWQPEMVAAGRRQRLSCQLALRIGWTSRAKSILVCPNEQLARHAQNERAQEMPRIHNPVYFLPLVRQFNVMLMAPSTGFVTTGLVTLTRKRPSGPMS